MTDITTLRWLITRLNAGAGPDAVLDADIRIATPNEYESDLRRARKHGTVTRTLTGFGGRKSHGTFHAPDYTAKLDAAISLYPDQHRPSRIPSTPRAVCIEALGVRIAMLEGRNNG